MFNTGSWRVGGGGVNLDNLRVETINLFCRFLYVSMLDMSIHLFHTCHGRWECEHFFTVMEG